MPDTDLEHWFALGNLGSHQAQTETFGYAVHGEILETAAFVAESGGGFNWRGFTWDYPHRPRRYPPPPWMTLPWLCEHIKRDHAKWPSARHQGAARRTHDQS